MSLAPRLSMRGVAKRFGATQALGGVDLEVAPGEIHALVGENGAGKSTLLKVLAGVVAPDEGTLAIDGRPYAPRGPLDARAAGLAMIHQELALAPHLSVAENLFLGCEPRRGPLVDRARLREQARAALARVGRGELDPDQRLGLLAPADRQRVEIARALAHEARVLVLDEPTSSLARGDVEGLLAHLKELAARGVSVIYVSHVFEELFALGGRYTVLRDGVSVARGALAETDPDRLVGAMVGRAVGELYPRRPARPGEVVLALRELAGRRLPERATLELRRGEVLGLAGLVGAGRTELLRAVFGLEPVARGEVRVLAHTGPRTPSQRWRSGAGFLSEDRKGEGLALGRSLAENLLLPVLGRHARGGFTTPARLERAAEPWLARLGVRARGPAQAARELSGGNQQKVALARLFAAQCDVLLLDEPTRGVDVGAKSELYAAIDRLAREEQKAVLVVSSYLPELLGLSDRIAVMARGVLEPARPVEELDEARLLAAMTGRGSA